MQHISWCRGQIVSLHTWWVYVVAVFLLSATPGPNMLHIMTRSVAYGFRRSMAAMAGCFSALVLMLLGSAGGMAAVLMTAPLVFEVLRYAGVAYLVYLGIRAWRSNEAAVEIGADQLAPPLSTAKMFQGGFLISISNPKAILFAAAFLPQFINQAAPKGPQVTLLVATFAVIEICWYIIYATGGLTLARYLTRPHMKRLFNRATGVLFIGFGLSLLMAWAG